MKIDISNKRVSNVIAGILLVFVACVFIATTLGVVGNHLYIQHNFVEDSPVLCHSGDIGNTDFVPVDQDCLAGEFNTAQGHIYNIQHEYCDGLDADGYGYDEEFIFPLCFEDPTPAVFGDLFTNWYKLFEVCGGYEPKACSSWFNVYQYKSTGYSQIGTDSEYIGWKLQFEEITKAEVQFAIDNTGGWYYPDDTTRAPIYVGDISLQGVCCCTSYWVAFIDSSCNNGACIESNQIPSTIPPCETDPTSGEIPGKKLTVALNTTWTGCGDDAQDFDLILVQILRIPNSRINM
jgi:hypothetical protein